MTRVRAYIFLKYQLEVIYWESNCIIRFYLAALQLFVRQGLCLSSTSFSWLELFSLCGNISKQNISNHIWLIYRISIVRSLPRAPSASMIMMMSCFNFEANSYKAREEMEHNDQNVNQYWTVCQQRKQKYIKFLVIPVCGIVAIWSFLMVILCLWLFLPIRSEFYQRDKLLPLGPFEWYWMTLLWLLNAFMCFRRLYNASMFLFFVFLKV